MHMRINAKIFCFLDFLAIYQLKFFYKLHNSTKLDKGYRLVYKLSCLVGKKNSTFFLVNLVKICLKIFNFTWQESMTFDYQTIGVTQDTIEDVSLIIMEDPQTNLNQIENSWLPKTYSESNFF